MKKLLLWLFGLTVAAPVLLVLLFRFVPVPLTSYMLQSPVKPVQHDWVAKERIAEVMRKAVVAAEDQKFWEHDGFDFEAMQKAYQGNQKGRPQRGGSTISQQTAKNLFLWPGGGYVRKGIEAYFTVLIEVLWPKARILEVYLNSAEFGAGIYGVEAAAQKYFRKPAAQLSAGEAARLAAVLPSPRRWKVEAPGPYVQSRSAWILRQIGRSGPPPERDEEPAPPPEEDPLAEEAEAAPPMPQDEATPAPEETAPPATTPELDPDDEPLPPPESLPAEAATAADQPAVESPP